MLSLHTNAAALSTQNALAFNNKSLSASMAKLGTGFRINSAMDDAAGLQIANRLKAQQSGMTVAMRNSQNAISLMQTAEGALSEVNTMLVRMKDLATQSADASASDADKTAMQAEYDSLASEITNIMGNTTFGGEKLLAQKVTADEVAKATVSHTTAQKALGAAADAASTASGASLHAIYNDAKAKTTAALGTYNTTANETNAKAWADAVAAEEKAKLAVDDATKNLAKLDKFKTDMTALMSTSADAKLTKTLSFQIGATGEETMELDLSSTLRNLHSNLSKVSVKYTSAGVASTATGDELTKDANGMINDLQAVLDEVGALRSAMGAASNRLQHTNANLGNMSTNTQAAYGRIMDVDYATETSNMTKNQMLMQASSAMLKQSNSMSQMVASLLQ